MLIKKEKIFFIILISLFLAYFVFQTKHFFTKLNIEYNYNNNTYINKDKIVFSGKGEHLKSLIINQEKIFLDLDNNFSKDIYLYKGKNIINIKYENIFDKKFEENVIIFR